VGVVGSGTGDKVGREKGIRVGFTDLIGAKVGRVDGEKVGNEVDFIKGLVVGIKLGDFECGDRLEGIGVGALVGAMMGLVDGFSVGKLLEGKNDREQEGIEEGVLLDGLEVGNLVGPGVNCPEFDARDGLKVSVDGLMVGPLVDSENGLNVVRKGLEVVEEGHDDLVGRKLGFTECLTVGEIDFVGCTVRLKLGRKVGFFDGDNTAEKYFENLH